MAHQPISLGVLDQSPIPEGASGGQALANTLDLARLTDSLGFSRYWLAEHHGSPMLACAAPEAMIGPVAAATRRMKVGSGGVMLPHYSPFKVAETFSMLAGLFPGRIDLGIGRAPGSDRRTAVALQRDRNQAMPDDFPQQLTELLAYLYDGLPEGHPFADLAATLPGGRATPEIWLLGSSPQSGIWAAELGLPYMFADFIVPRGAPVAERYLREFRPSGTLSEPRPAVAVSAIVADSEEEARRLSASVRWAMMLLQSGRLAAVPPPDEALALLEEHTGSADAAPSGRRYIVGTAEQAKAEIEAVAREYGAGEVLVVTITHDHAARRRSYELLAEAFGLERELACSASA